MTIDNKVKELFIRVLITVTSVLIVIEVNYGQQKKTAKPNFVFFILDDMTTDLFNALPQGKGKNYTPNIDRLVKEGTLMMNQYCPSPVCTPSRFSSLTGKYASRSQHKSSKNAIKKYGQSYVEFNSFITKEDQTLPKYLKEAGYRTGFVGKSHVVEDDDYVLLPFDSDPNDAKVKEVLLNNKKITERMVKDIGFDFAKSIYYNNPEFNGPEALSVHNMDWITESALEFLNEKSDKPFYLYFATTLPHYPQEASRSWNANRLATPNGFLDKEPNSQPKKESIPARLKANGFEVNDRNCNLLWLDDAIGEVLKKLKENKKLDNTIIFFFNDNGQGAKGTVYQSGVHNPSIIWKKGGFKTGKINYTKVSNVDFAPTILEMAGTSIPNNVFDGKSFLPALNGNKSEIHTSLYLEMGFTRAIIKGNYKYLALRYPEYALKWTNTEKAKMLKNVNDQRRKRNQPIANPDEDPSKPYSHLTLLPGGNYAEFESTGKMPAYYDLDQLYDLSTDPDEQRNLAKDKKYEQILSEMKIELKKYIDSLPGGFPL